MRDMTGPFLFFDGVMSHRSTGIMALPSNSPAKMTPNQGATRSCLLLLSKGCSSISTFSFKMLQKPMIHTVAPCR